jgi:menaquinone-dependent protoporphyrinogen oxidase
MEIKVLVAYASKYGATAEIAEKVGQTLRQAGLQVDVMSVNLVSDLAQYKAVVLGSAIYMGQWRKEVGKFLQSNEKLLAERPVWLFSSGPMGKGDPVQLVKGWRFPKKQRAIIERIKPRDTAIFHGMLDMKKLNFFERWIIRNVKAPVGDFRDWDAIASWAAAIAGELQKRG